MQDRKRFEAINGQVAVLKNEPRIDSDGKACDDWRIVRFLCNAERLAIPSGPCLARPQEMKIHA